MIKRVVELHPFYVGVVKENQSTSTNLFKTCLLTNDVEVVIASSYRGSFVLKR